MASPIRDKRANRRVGVLAVLLALGLAGGAARAFCLQVGDAPHPAALARSEHDGPAETIPAIRGTIFDATGVPLAIGEQETTVVADPQQVENPRGIALAAHALLGANANALYPQLLDRKRQFVFIERFADPTSAARFL